MSEVRDHEVIVEQAEALQSWLSGFPLSGRAKGALQRELEAIMADGAGTDGEHPLAGLTIADFISALHLPNGGAVGRVKSVGDAVLKELRAAIPPDTKVPRKARKSAKAADATEAKPRRRRAATNGTAPTNGAEPEEETTNSKAEPITVPEVVAEVPQTEVPQAEAPQAEPVRRRPGRPKGSTKAVQNGAAVRQEAPAPAQEPTEAPAKLVAVEAVAAEPVVAEETAPKRRPGRPRRVAASVAIIDTPGLNDNSARTSIGQRRKPEQVPVPDSVNQAAPKESETDPVLAHVIQLWPSLHSQARRAVVHYANSLLGETVHSG